MCPHEFQTGFCVFGKVARKRCKFAELTFPRFAELTSPKFCRADLSSPPAGSQFCLYLCSSPEDVFQGSFCEHDNVMLC